MLGIAVIALLAVGTLIGVSIPRPPDISLPLTSEQEERRDKLLRNSEELDRGSIALLAVEGEALLWFGTRNDGALLCGMLDIEGQAVRSACSAKNEMRNSIVYMPDYSDGTTTGTSYDAQLLLSGSGVPAGVLQSYERGEDLWKYMGLTTAERQTAERLMADDRESHPSIVGYLGAMPIWLLSSREERCLLVETATDGDVRSCIPAAPRQELTIGAGSSTEAMTIEPEQRITLGMPGEDGRDAALLELRFKQGQMPYLTITIGEPPPFWGTRIE
ncbi:hypothetical protein J2Y69_001878 [Microbacterium resistens]|uniref:Uncharacterized protein n=1 Tax=Microbacterium resistens TaxID=156977 RepID=A0ABU1SEE8_9MICO|nr:hypothetical protein [Microbacterium resistens]MDR6867277.1 hypothetical protein [Microbacterium resistens]